MTLLLNLVLFFEKIYLAAPWTLGLLLLTAALLSVVGIMELS